MFDCVIIGAGPAGLSAAVSAYDQGVKNILVLERDVELGGILNQCIHNGFGLHRFNEELTGPEYAQKFIDLVKDHKITYQLNTMVLEMIQSDDYHEIIAVSKQHGYQHIHTKTIILAMGARERTRFMIQIPGSRPSGVLTAGTAQRYINIEGKMVGKKVVILGSGDIGLIMARRMSLVGAKVLRVVEIEPHSNGLTRNIVQCLDDYNIPLFLSHTVIEIHGNHRLEGVSIAKVDKDKRVIEGTQEYVACDTLLLSVGLIPENELSKTIQLDIDPATKGPIVNEYMETSVAGVFACGNVVHIHDLVDYVSMEAEKAGKSVAEYLTKSMAKTQVVQVEPQGLISYCVPQYVHQNTSLDTIDIMYRVKKVIKKATVLLEDERGEIIKKIPRLNMAPGEMEKIRITRKDLSVPINHITLRLIESEVA